MTFVYHITNEAEAGLIDLATALVRGVHPVVLLVSPGVKRRRWPLGVQVVDVDLPSAGMAAARGLLAVARGLDSGGEDGCFFVGCDTVVRPDGGLGEMYERADAIFVQHGGFMEPAHWLWRASAATAAELLDAMAALYPPGKALGGLLKGAQGGGCGDTQLAASGVAVRFASACLVGPALWVMPPSPLVHVWGVKDFGGVDLPGECLAVHCGDPALVRDYPVRLEAVRRAMEGAVRALRG